VQLSVNPEVTVRSRGVMEKCTYCVQRIQNGKIDAKAQRRPLQDGEILTACQQACPTQAIEFGDVNEPASRVARAHANPRAYAMLAELNIKPRTHYLARIRNPHPALAEKRQDHHDHSHHGDGHGHS
jgi:molybdopterin-containing oxidoreductase family iron-sulfur binding subunit